MPETAPPEPVLLEEQAKAEPQKRRIGRPPGPLKKKQRPRTDIGLQRATKKDFNILDAVRLRIQHKLTWQEVADRLGMKEPTIRYQLDNLYDLLDINRAEAYEITKPVLMGVAEERLLLDLLDEDKRKKATLNNTAYAFAQVHTARRLEAGKTTSNVGLLAAIRMADSSRGITETEANAT